jgi:hypothetical protein
MLNKKQNLLAATLSHPPSASLSKPPVASQSSRRSNSSRSSSRSLRLRGYAIFPISHAKSPGVSSLGHCGAFLGQSVSRCDTKIDQKAHYSAKNAVFIQTQKYVEHLGHF